jgi:peptidoglycan/LPS O-acetylase OafA/YrhL
VSATFPIYLWHYLTARAIYDELVHPLVQLPASAAVLLSAVAVVAFALGRWRGSHARARGWPARRRR